MGYYSDEPDPPTYFQAVETYDCVRYTHVDQQQWFMDRINHAFGGQQSTNVRIEPDGHTIKWFGYYWLRLGDWLYRGNTPVTDEQLRASALLPQDGAWPPPEPVEVPGADTSEPGTGEV